MISTVIIMVETYPPAVMKLVIPNGNQHYNKMSYYCSENGTLATRATRKMSK